MCPVRVRRKKWDVCGWFCDWCKPDQISRKLPGAGQLYMQRNEKTVPRPAGGPGNSWDIVFPGRLDVGFRMFIIVYTCLHCFYSRSSNVSNLYTCLQRARGKIGNAPCESQRPWFSQTKVRQISSTCSERLQ